MFRLWCKIKTVFKGGQRKDVWTQSEMNKTLDGLVWVCRPQTEERQLQSAGQEVSRGSPFKGREGTVERHTLLP